MDRSGFDVWKKELEKWNENEKSSDETKLLYCIRDF